MGLRTITTTVPEVLKFDIDAEAEPEPSVPGCASFSKRISISGARTGAPPTQRTIPYSIDLNFWTRSRIVLSCNAVHFALLDGEFALPSPQSGSRMRYPHKPRKNHLYPRNPLTFYPQFLLKSNGHSHPAGIDFVTYTSKRASPT